MSWNWSLDANFMTNLKLSASNNPRFCAVIFSQSMFSLSAAVRNWTYLSLLTYRRFNNGTYGRCCTVRYWTYYTERVFSLANPVSVNHPSVVFRHRWNACIYAPLDHCLIYLTFIRRFLNVHSTCLLDVDNIHEKLLSQFLDTRL